MHFVYYLFYKLFSLEIFRYAVIHIPNQITDDSINYHSIVNWEEVFLRTFQLPAETKTSQHITAYQGVPNMGGAAFGYRTDDEREFLETRLLATG